MTDPFIERAAEFERQHRLYMRAFGHLDAMQDGIPGSVNELRILREIAAVAEGLPVHLLASWLSLSPSLVSHLIARLRRQQFVQLLGPAPWDARIKLFVATQTGQSVATDYAEEVQLCAQKLLGRFHPFAQGRILAAMRQVGHEIVTRW